MHGLLFSLIGLLAAAAPALAADVPSYDAPGDRVAAALLSVAMRRETVRRTTDYCGNAYPEMKTAGEEAFVAWTHRQAGFLTVASSIRDKVTGATAKDPPKAAQWQHFFAEALPKQVDQIAGAMLQPLAEMPLDEGRRHMCADLIANAQSGALDLDQWDPNTAALLREIAGKGAGASPVGPGYAPTPADPQARRDAAALLGHWQSTQQTIVHYNGLAETAAPPCTNDFDGQRSVYLCSDPVTSVRSVAEYRVPAPGTLETTTVENTAQPQAVGQHAQSSFRVEGERLIVTAYPATTPNTPDEAVIKIESILVRAPVKGSAP